MVPSHQPPVAGHALPSTDHWPLTTGRRRGISLMEVLVSIGIVAIGLVSILSLLPVAAHQAGRAEEEERKSVLGLNAVQDLKNRGVFDIANWRAYNSSIQDWVQYDLAANPPGDYLPPVMIDPYMIAAAQPSQYPTVENCPTAPLFTPSPASPLVHGLGLKRLTLAQTLVLNTSTNKLEANIPLAEALCISADDTFSIRPDDASLPAESSIIYQNPATKTNPLKRDYEGLYSWLITIVPTELEYDHIAPQPKRQYLMSLVVFSRRIRAVPNGDGTQEEMGKVFEDPPNNIYIDGIGGGDMLLQDNTPVAEAKLELADGGQWLMLCRYEPAPPGGPTPVWPVFQWYRVISAGEIEAPNAGQPLRQRAVTLSGPDWQKRTTFPPETSIGWPPNIPTAFQKWDTYACLFDDIVAVYQRPIWLEGPSVWSQ